MNLMEKTLVNIMEADRGSGKKAQDRLDMLTKPQGSLGTLERIAVKLAQIQSNPLPQLGAKIVMTMAGDHGVVEEGVSAFPQEVTPQMVLNFLNHGAAINVLAKHAGARVVVADIGIAAEPIQHPDLINRRICSGTRNMAREAAMTESEAIAAIEAGIELVNEQIDRGVTLVATGEMGIGNTTPSSAILACFSGREIDSITGRGTGIDDTGLIRKQNAIRRALEINQPDSNQPLDVLRKVGGLEIAAITGIILGASARRVPVVIDGFISSAAALVAYKMNAKCRDYLFASHLSQEPGHRIMLEEIGLEPMLYLDMRLGEGSGAVLAFHIFEAAVKIINEMATFEEAGVSNKE
ncbi:MAG: nicotinate-nucleotide--dimethylbenzimidazole phosphoribosyltransferase [Firmicutes bacterium HGW-Firmicutes-15]|nr:MAG: nicotinate-nucleotide--dimethylbenzimidazole phosphoribosyltransferase [Firmicutes bacterium HGW-Firmicutes-15]